MSDLDRDFTDAELDSMSVEELQALVPEPETVETVEEINGEEFTVVEEAPTAEDKMSAFLSGAQDVISLGKRDEIQAAIDTTVDIAADPNLGISDFSELMDISKREKQAAYDALNRGSELEFAAGQVFGGLAQNVVGGAVKSVSALAMNRFKDAFALGTVYGMDSIDDLGSLEGVSSAVGMGLLSGTFSQVGKVPQLLRGAKDKVSSAIKGSLFNEPKSMLDDEVVLRFLDNIGVKGSSNLKEFENIILKRKGATPEKYLNSILKYKKELGLENSLSPAHLQKNMDELAESIWEKEIMPIMGEIDKANPQGAINSEELQARLIDYVKSVKPDKTDKQIETILSNINVSLGKIKSSNMVDPLTGAPRGLSLAETQTIKNSVRNISSSSSEANEVVLAAHRAIKDEMEAAVEFNLGAEGVEEFFKNPKSDYGFMRETADILNKEIIKHRTDIQQFGESWVDLKNRVKLLAALGGSRYAVEGTSLESSVGTGLEVAFGVTFLNSNYKTLGAVGKVLKNSDFTKNLANSTKQVSQLLSIGDIIENSPGKYAPIVNRLLASASLGTADFVKELAFTQAHISLDHSPLERTSEEVFSRAGDISTILGKFDINLRDQFMGSLKSGDNDKALSILESVSNTDLGSQYIAPGIGFDGVVRTELGIMKSKELIQNANISNTQKSVHLEQLLPKNGSNVPKFVEEVPFSSMAIIHKRNKKGKKEPKI